MPSPSTHGLPGWHTPDGYPYELSTMPGFAGSSAYYLRYNKTFSRMGGTLRTLSADNRDFFLALDQALNGAP